MEDELYFTYNGAMEVENNGNIPDSNDWDILVCIYCAVDVDSEEGEFIDSSKKVICMEAEGSRP